MRRYNVRRAVGITRDLDLIEEHLVRSYVEFGDDPGSAVERAAERIEGALGFLRTFEQQPHRGTELPEIRPGLRSVTSRSFVVYFEVDGAAREVRILAVFFGGIDHRRQILDRLA